MVFTLAFAGPVFADPNGVPNNPDQASDFGNTHGGSMCRHEQAPGQGGLDPGEIGAYIKAFNAANDPGAWADVMHGYSNLQGPP